MSGFARQGTFKSRDRLLEGLRGKLAKLREGALRGFTETWERSGDADVARLSGFGARIEITVEASSWQCAVSLPAWLPIAPAAIEAKFDQEFADLKNL
jgi:hypothetical protein